MTTHGKPAKMGWFTVTGICTAQVYALNSNHAKWKAKQGWGCWSNRVVKSAVRNPTEGD